MTLFIDVGTNGEIVLGNSDWLISCACSAGPAFEGAGAAPDACRRGSYRGGLDRPADGWSPPTAPSATRRRAASAVRA